MRSVAADLLALLQQLGVTGVDATETLASDGRVRVRLVLQLDDGRKRVVAWFREAPRARDRRSRG